MDRRKNNKGQPRKQPEEKRVPLTFRCKAKNKERIRTKLNPLVKNLDKD